MIISVSKDRGWFKTFTPFTSKLDPSPFYTTNGPKHLPVLGIGTVEIPTKRSPNTSGSSSHGSLLLHEVLYAPGFLCNVIGQPLLFTDGYSVSTSCGSKSRGTIKDSQGKNAAYFDPKSPLYAIKVRRTPNGPTLGAHALKKDRTYMLSCQWDTAEQREWQVYKARNGLLVPGLGAASYTAEETAFLKKNYGSEFKFLFQYGLKIHNEEDREEGRAILRAIMCEDSESEDGDSLSQEGEDDDLDEESEFDFEGHQADYNFTERQLDWIEKYYRNSEQFMISYGLKFYDEEDLEEAKAIVEAMMTED
jgi:hypothetical protein